MWQFDLDDSFVQCSVEDGELVIDKLFVSVDERGINKGYKLLDLAKNKALELKLNMSLYAEPDDDMPASKLVEYYADYGFESDGDCEQLMTYFF